MPLVDRRTGSVVLRIVYDGPPEAGKTTNLKHLSERLSLSRRGTLESPGGHARTQFFDWLDVTGGWIGGHRVRCQLVTVPGQIQLARRRRYILDSADVVVFVADSRSGAAAEVQAALRSLSRALAHRAHVPLVLQANKQDLDGARPPGELHRALALGQDVPAIAAQASGGDGVLETFTLAVRLAVDHVRALIAGGHLEEGEAAGAPELLSALGAEAPGASGAVQALEEIAETAGALVARAQAGEAPPPPPAPEDPGGPVGLALPPPPEPIPFRLPPVDLPAGLVWPGISGRAALAALSSPVRVIAAAAPWAPAGALELQCSDGWFAHTSPQLRFAELEEGRLALFEAVRWQTRLGALTPRGRTYALSPEDDGARLWVLTPSRPPAWSQLEEAFARGDREHAAAIARRALAALELLREHGVEVGDLDHVTAERPPVLLHTPWTAPGSRLAAQRKRLLAVVVP